MEIKAETLKDKIYNFVDGNKIEVLFGIFMIVGLSAGFYMDSKVQEQHRFDKLQAQILASKNELLKLEEVKLKKIPLICKKQILFADDYDLVQIKDNNYIVTEEFINRPFEGYNLKDCNLYKQITNSFKPQPVQTLEEKTKIKLDNLNQNLINNQLEIEELIDDKAKLRNVLDEANKDINKLKGMLLQQDNELAKLLIVEAKYKEIKELLTIVLNKKNIKLKDLIVKPVPPKVKKIKVKKIVQKIKEHTVTDIIHTKIIIKNDEDRLRRYFYTIKFLTTQIDGKKVKIVKAPTKKDLNSRILTSHQIENASNVIAQFKNVITRLSKTMELRYNLPNNMIRNSIKRNVGI